MNHFRFTTFILFLIVCFSCTKKNVALDPSLYAKIPDINFEKLLIMQNIDDVQDGQVLRSNIENISFLLLQPVDPNGKIKSLAGIEAFKNLEFLSCHNHAINDLNLSDNLSLTRLYCDNNQLSSLNISKNEKLQFLSCSNNKLASLDISKNINLKGIWCWSNFLTKFDASNNVNLDSLRCGDNLLKDLDLSKNNLKNLDCHNNQLRACLNFKKGIGAFNFE